MKNMILAVIFTAAPAAAQTTVRVPVSGVNAIPSLGATPVPTIMMMPTLSPGLQAPALSALALTPTLVPAPVQPALAISIHAAAAKPADNSPLGVILDASANEAKKTTALDRMFDNFAPSSPEPLAVPAGSGPTHAFSKAPSWFATSKLDFRLLHQAGKDTEAILRYGKRHQFKMIIDVYPGGGRISFEEYASIPVGTPKRSFEASLKTEASRKAAAKILRAAQVKRALDANDKAVLDVMLSYLDAAPTMSALQTPVAATAMQLQ